MKQDKKNIKLIKNKKGYIYNKSKSSKLEKKEGRNKKNIFESIPFIF